MAIKQQDQIEKARMDGSSSYWRTISYFLFSCVATVAVFYYLFSKISIGEVVQLIRELRYPTLIAFIFLSLSTSFFRAWRYLVVLRVAGVRPRGIPLFLVVIIRNLFSDLLPARIGTMIYVFLANTRLGVNLAAASSSFALAFLFDMLALVPLVVLAAWMAASAGTMPFWPLIIGAMVLCAVVVFILMVLPLICGWLSSLPGVFLWLKNLLAGVQHDLKEVKRQGLYFRILLLSLLVRVGKYVTYLILLYGLLESLGLYSEDLRISGAFLGIVASELSASTPISGIGGFGVFEGTWVLVFRLLGLPARASELTAVAHHLFTQVYGYGLGVLALLVLLLPVFKVAEGDVRVASGKDSARSFYIRLLLFVAAISFLAAVVLKIPANTQADDVVAAIDSQTVQDRSAQKQLTKMLQGRLVFDSNRSGTFGIYAVAVDGSGLEMLVDTEMEEMYPEVMADAKSVFFARARSTSRMALSDVWVIDLERSQEKLLAENGTFPSYTEKDSDAVYFERARRKIIRIDLKSGVEQEVFPAGNREFRRFQVVKPRISPDGRFVAFTSNNPREWHAWYADLKTKQAFQITAGCEPTWFPDSSQIAFIKIEGAKDESGIFSYDLKTKMIKELVDFDAPRGHEYFPTVHEGGRFIYYASSRKGEHSHLSANYQLFVFDLENQQRVRITFDSSTNRWPKFLP